MNKVDTVFNPDEASWRLSVLISFNVSQHFAREESYLSEVRPSWDALFPPPRSAH